MRAVIDTNIWVSSILNRRGAPAAIRAAFEHGQFTLVISEPLLVELSDVLARPRFARVYGITPVDTRELLALLRERADLVTVKGLIKVSRDPDDDILLETAISGRADVLVTRDDDLKATEDVAVALKKHGIVVSTVRRFLPLLGATTSED